MSAFGLALGTAVWLGVLTSISPCPLASNIAAISFISKDMGSRRRVLLSGMLYTVGRLVAYAVIAGLIVASVVSVPGVANTLQVYMNRILGPVLVLAGVLILGVIPLPSFGSSMAARLGPLLERSGWVGAVLMGVLFALSFCPVSAALYFGSLIPLSIQHKSVFLMPGLYGLGTALPVVGFAFVVALGAGQLGKVFDRVTQFEAWFRRITGVVFILVGLYYTAVFHLGWSPLW